MNSSVLSSQRKLIFHPLSVLVLSVAGATVYACYMLRSPAIRSSVFTLGGPFSYVVPIVVPFVAFLFDRAERWQTSSVVQHVVDLVVIGTAIGRVVAHVPYISGHTIFLSYAILSSRSVVLRVTATLVMIEAVYLKYFVWRDWTSSRSGILLGTSAAFVVSRWGWKPVVCSEPSIQLESEKD